jgi:flavodoxin
MKKAVIYYSSRKGTTKYFGEEIGDYLKEKKYDVKIYSVLDAKPEQLTEVETVLLGGWTHGLFFILQHPDHNWIDFSKSLPSLRGKKVGLFTTYKIATGSLFRKMKTHLKNKADGIELILKAKSEKLLDSHKQQLDKFLEN